MNVAYITNCVASGFSITQIADACGVTPSAVTQFIDEHGVAEKVANMQMEQRQRAVGIDTKYDEIEERVLKQLANSIAFVSDPLKLARVLQVVNSAKRRSIPAENLTPATAPVPLQLPQHITNTFVFNGNNEAVAIGDRTLVTMPATEARKLLEVRHVREPQNDW